jgi:hypothetical protein
MDIQGLNLKDTCCDLFPVIIVPGLFWAAAKIISVTFPTMHFIEGTAS